MYAWIYVSLYECMNLFMFYVCMHICMYAYIFYVCISVCVYVYIHTCLRRDACVLVKMLITSCSLLIPRLQSFALEEKN